MRILLLLLAALLLVGLASCAVLGGLDDDEFGDDNFYDGILPVPGHNEGQGSDA